MVETASMKGEQGLDVISKMAPEFRDDVGPGELLEETYARYRKKNAPLDFHAAEG